MTEWRIRLPIRSRDDALSEVAFDARVLDDPAERRVVRELVLQAALGGERTVGQFLDRLDRASAAERRLIYDDAREAAGLERIANVEAGREFEQAQRAARLRAAQRPIPACAICGVHPTGAGGMPAEAPPARRWHCAEHEHLAEPGDVDPPPLPLTMSMREIDPDEDERIARQDEMLKREQERRLRERREEAEAIRAARQRYEESVAEDDYVRPTIAGIRGRRMDAQ